MKRIFGVVIFAFGLSLSGWLTYNLLIARAPETQGKNPLLPIAISGASLYVGYKWVRGEQAG